MCKSIKKVLNKEMVFKKLGQTLGVIVAVTIILCFVTILLAGTFKLVCWMFGV